jgi:DNA-binding response OmpR family regulator
VYRSRILVVDDNETIRKTMKEILESEGYQVETASTGKEAIKKSNSGAFDLALLDIQLPDMEGVELLESLRDCIPKMRKVMLTGHPSMQNAIDALNKKADAYLIKPVDPGYLLAVIQEQLSLQQEEIVFDQFKVEEFLESRVLESEAINNF